VKIADLDVETRKLISSARFAADLLRAEATPKRAISLLSTLARLVEACSAFDRKHRAEAEANLKHVHHLCDCVLCRADRLGVPHENEVTK
jgi:hypothetical protein